MTAAFRVHLFVLYWYVSLEVRCSRWMSLSSEINELFDSLHMFLVYSQVRQPSHHFWMKIKLKKIIYSFQVSN